MSSAFSADGKLQPVPERFVPPDFAQWGQSVNAWSTCTSYKQEEGELMIRTKYMLPTVGAQACAVAAFQTSIMLDCDANHAMRIMRSSPLRGQLQLQQRTTMSAAWTSSALNPVECVSNDDCM